MSIETCQLDFRKYRRIPDCEDERQLYKEDLLSLGYPEREIKRFLGGKTAVAKDLLLSKRLCHDEGRTARYKELRVHATDSNWIFFDPFNCALDSIDKNDMPMVVKLAFYTAGSAYYLEQNINSNAVRMRTGKSFPKGKRIKYTSSGPELVDIVADESDTEGPM